MRRIKTERRIQKEYERFVHSCARVEERTGRSFEAEGRRTTDRVTAAEWLNTLASRVKNLGRTTALKVSTPKPTFGWVNDK